MILERKMSSIFLWGAREEGTSGKAQFQQLRETEVRVQGCKKTWKQKRNPQKKKPYGRNPKISAQILSPKPRMYREGLKNLEESSRKLWAGAKLELSRNFSRYFLVRGDRVCSSPSTKLPQLFPSYLTKSFQSFS